MPQGLYVRGFVHFTGELRAYAQAVEIPQRASNLSNITALEKAGSSKLMDFSAARLLISAATQPEASPWKKN
jgi:hypothetical protein